MDEEKIILHFAFSETGEEDIPILDFPNKDELILFLSELKKDGTIWLFTAEGEYSEIIITDNKSLLIKTTGNLLASNNILFLQAYPSFEDAYSVALTMREGHKRCYNSQL
jgi:hypothetical protein